MNRIIALVVVIVVLLFAASSTVFVVDQRHMAVLSGRGEATPELLGPGLHAKLPPPLQTLMLVDRSRHWIRRMKTATLRLTKPTCWSIR
jgi:membrane protease subunit HflC